MDTSLNSNGNDLRRRLAAAREQSGHDNGQRINVAGVGGVVSAAYEQLRNAAEYTQEHLLRQRAIRRYYIRNLSFKSQKDINPSLADELVIELTQAGYVRNDSLPVGVTGRLLASMQRHYNNFWRMRQAGVTYDYAYRLALDLLSVEAEGLVSESEKRRQAVFTLFAYFHYQAVLPPEQFADPALAGSYENSLYVAVHKALRKSDLAIIRYEAWRLHTVADDDIHRYVKFFVMIDGLFFAESNDRLARYISRYGAPLRVLKSMLEDNPETEDLLPDRNAFLLAYENQVRQEYRDAEVRLNKGVVKSIIFLLITKAIIGLAVEIPYDLLLSGVVVITPLLINLLTPVVFMALLRAGLRLPGQANTSAIVQYGATMLYGGGRDLYATPRKRRYAPGFTIVYGLMFIMVFGLVVAELIALHFNIVQGLIFFIFLGTASFLGFRLSRIVRELELVAVRPGLIASARDFLYLPFILLGQWLSDKYARINLVALMLDTVIELPLKTILRLFRQWTDFLSDKKDEI